MYFRKESREIGLKKLWVLAALAVLLPAESVHAAELAMPARMPDGSIFDAVYYGEANPDVYASVGDNAAKLYEHYVLYGAAEGRLPYAPGTIIDTELPVADGSVFDPVYYAENNPDVVLVWGNDILRLYQHYLAYGRYEGRLPCAPGEEEEAEYPLARAVLDQVGWDLRAAFNWSASLTYYGHGAPGMPDTPEPGTRWYANFGFTNHKGNCFVMAATFCEMAKLLGYEPRQIAGQVPSVKGGLTPHSWVEIDINGVTYVFDPDFTFGTGRNGYQISYGQSGTWRYTEYAPMLEIGREL